LLVCSCCTKSKLMASTTGHDITTFYEKTYPGEPDDNGVWLAGQYAVKFDDLKAMVGGVEACVEASGETPSEKRLRKVTIPRGTSEVGTVCRLASQIARSDRRFGDMSAAEFESVKDFGRLRRVARQARCAIVRRPNDVAYWKARVATLMGWQQGQGQRRVPRRAPAAAVPSKDGADTGEHEAEAVVDKRETEANGAALQLWQPMGLRCRCGSPGGCAAVVAAQGAALQLWQPRGLRYSCGSPGGCAAGVAAQGAALQVWQPRGLRCRCDSRRGLRWRRGSRGCCAGGVAAEGVALEV